MKNNLTRVVLYFPKEHPISQYPQNIRNKVAKSMIERGLLTLSDKDVLKEIRDDLKIIKDMLANGGAKVSTHHMDTELSSSDIALIDQMLGLR